MRLIERQTVVSCYSSIQGVSFIISNFRVFVHTFNLFMHLKIVKGVVKWKRRNSFLQSYMLYVEL